jgi:hypothetical protein
LHHNQNKLSGFLFCFIAVDLEKNPARWQQETGQMPTQQRFIRATGPPFRFSKKLKGVTHGRASVRREMHEIVQNGTPA